MNRTSHAYSVVRSAVVVVSLVLAVAFPVSSLAATAVGFIASVSGTVDILRGGSLPAVPALTGDQVNVGDFIRTKSNSRAEIRFNDGNVVKVAQRSRIDISEYASDRDTRTLTLARGKLEAIVVPPRSRSAQKSKRFEVHTPNAVAGVRGTDLFVFYDANATGVAVKELSGGDEVYAYNLSDPDRVVDVPERMFTLIRENHPPTRPRPATEPELLAHQRDVTPGRIAGYLTAGVADMSGMMRTALLADSAGTYAPPPLSETVPGALNPDIVLAPSIEVGLVDMLGTGGVPGGIYTMQVGVTASFLASSASSVPTIWNATSVTGTWSPLTAAPPFNPVGFTIPVSGAGPNGTASADVAFSTWNTGTGTWSASVNGGGLINGSNVTFSGTASGTGASAGTSGTITGSGGGTVP